MGQYIYRDSEEYKKSAEDLYKKAKEWQEACEQVGAIARWMLYHPKKS